LEVAKSFQKLDFIGKDSVKIPVNSRLRTFNVEYIYNWQLINNLPIEKELDYKNPELQSYVLIDEIGLVLDGCVYFKNSFLKDQDLTVISICLCLGI